MQTEPLKRWDRPLPDLNDMLIQCVGYGFGPRPIERIDDIRRARGEFAREIARRLRLGTADVVVDLGSGCGFYGRVIAPMVKHLYCLDVNADFLSFCENELSDFPNVSTHLIQYADLSPVSAAGVTKVFSSAVWIHFNFYDILIHLRKLHALLPRGGLLYFDFFDPAGIKDGDGFIFSSQCEHYLKEPSFAGIMVQYNSSSSVLVAAALTGFTCDKLWQVNAELYGAIFRKTGEPSALIATKN